MEAISRVWTWLIVLCIPSSINGMFFVRGGLGSHPEEIYISLSYYFLLITLAAIFLASVLFREYAKRARKYGQIICIPANLLFETEVRREPSISWTSAVIFFLLAFASLVFFSIRYGQSQIHCWTDRNPISAGFWASRLASSTAECKNPNQLAITARVGDDGTVFSPIAQYFPYLTDGILIAVIVFTIIAIVRMIREFVLCRATLAEPSPVSD